MNEKSRYYYSLLLMGLLSIAAIPVQAPPSDIVYNSGSNICTVYPNGFDDTANIQMAFNLVSGKSNGFVRLVAGEYILSQEIVACNFDGRFTGAGIGKTVLKTIETDDWPHRDEDPFPVVASVFLFYQDEPSPKTIKISHMTVEVNAFAEPYGCGFFGLNVFDIYGYVDGEELGDETCLSTELKNVKVIGEIVEAYGFWNTVNTFQVGGEPHVDDCDWYFESISGEHVVKDCIFDTVGAAIKYNSVNGKIQVKHNTIKDNFVGIWLFFCDTLNAPKREIKNNLITGSGWMGVAVWGSNSFTIKNNEITDGFIGLDMWGSDNNLVMHNLLYGNAVPINWDETGDNTWKNNLY